MSSEDMFYISDEDVIEMNATPLQPTPSPEQSSSTPATPTPPTPTPPPLTPYGSTQHTATPTYPSPLNPISNHDSLELFENQSDAEVPAVETKAEYCSQIRLDFLDLDGNKVSPSRYTSNTEIIRIMKSLILSENQKYRYSTASNIMSSVLLKDDVQKQVLKRLSCEFSDFLSNEKCPLKDQNLFKNLVNLENTNFENIFNECINRAGNLVRSFALLCFGTENLVELLKTNSKYEKQRLLAIMAICGVTRKRNVNVVQKVIGEFCKQKSANRQVLQLLQRLGLSLVSMTLRSDLDVISSHFMNDVRNRKKEIEIWDSERKMIEKEVKSEVMRNYNESMSCNVGGKVCVRYTPSEYIPKIVDIGELANVTCDDENILSLNVVNRIAMSGSAKEALEDHLDNCPAAFTVTYDNIDLGRTPNEVLGEATKDQSIHWCSSMVFEDTVLANELSDSEPKRCESVNFNDLVKLNKEEKNHLLCNYTKLVMNTIVHNWPKCFPDLKLQQIRHQYTDHFERGVKAFTGPLVCETESTLEGISVVIKTLVDTVCPAKDVAGERVAVHTTTFR